MMGSSVCADKQHKLHQLYHHNLTKKPSPLRDLDIPPRKLRHHDQHSPDGGAAAAFSKFLPAPGSDSDDSDDPYSSDHFRMFEFKVRKCSRSRSHDWTDCPFAHPGEKARRRDPRRFRYSGTVCPDFRKGTCPRADSCEFSHGVFECWLHPSRYRTEACKDGKNCKRKVCFFAHSSRQLRIVPADLESDDSPTRTSPNAAANNNHCCPLCHSMAAAAVAAAAAAASPNSTLIPHVSPPPSPPAPFSPEISRFHGLDGMRYKEALAEVMAAFEAMNPAAADLPPSPAASGGLPWLDVNFGIDQEQPQFAMSPSSGRARLGPGPAKFSSFAGRNLMEDGRNNGNGNEGGSTSGGPDLEWVNDLLT
ncbi:Zinc finger CCCH domain-containing protein 2 [Striga hermonthica]|uniref:Zinc finger CCCH domain-containing protein 2 n=1 Tax=Striga hermonthica TaxID=68872 RepID=A0A9N7MYT2_STRHE|nr:Zinc finger CCCH domain-containing protein 2 [Striga hermonthica]